MDVITFIEKDAVRAKAKSPLVLMSVCFVAFVIPVGLGILLRDDYNGVFEARTFVPNLLGALSILIVLLTALKPHRGTRRLFQIGLLGVALAVMLATVRVFFPIGARTAYSSSEAFWHESARCFTKGGAATVTTGLWLTFCAFATSSWPSRRWRTLFSAMAGASGVVMLGFHCDSSSAGHVLIAHVGQGIVLGAFVFVLQEVLFLLGLKRLLPELTAKLKNLHRIG